MAKNVCVSVSTDPVKNFQSIVEYAKKMSELADMLHCDVMDGIFVSNKTYNSTMVSNINQNTSLMLDVHLMVQEPMKEIVKYAEAGANIITVHYEAFSNKEDVIKAIRLIKSKKLLVGLAIKPQTSFNEIKTYAFDIDILLIMSVEPGLSGQKFMPEILDKIKECDKFRRENNLLLKIEVDGGINKQNAKQVVDAGADILVSGNYVFSATNKKSAIAELKK